jgi:photosystem II stability/assembly factor-like uncharacterized protein
VAAVDEHEGTPVIPHTRFFLRSLRVVLACSLLALLGLSGPAAEEASREQQIADLERQIQDLTKKLGELRGTKPADSSKSPSTTIPPEWIKTLTWRSIGPAAMGGRIVAFSVYEADPSLYWVATASGGLLKTTNNGVTFEHQFDREATVSIGDVCVAPSNKDIVWVGTGENNPRNSVSYGDGVYKSTDGGKTWKNMGLKNSFQIGRVVVHPKNPDIVYVGALGRLYGPNEERGLFKTIDGGKTWNKILYVDDKTGVIDMKMNPAEPETLLVATWERLRDGFDSHRGEPAVADGYDAYDPIKKWGPGGAIHKTTDGGKTFRKLTTGLPTCPLGRIGLDYSRKNPNVVYAIVDCAKIGMGTPPVQVYLGVVGENAPGGAKLTQISPDGPAAAAGLKVGDIVKAVDKKPLANFEELSGQIRAHKIGDKLTLTVQRDKETRDFVVTLGKRPAPAGPAERGFQIVDFRGEDVPGGVRVTRVLPQGMSEKAGLQVGDVIQKIDKTEVKNFRQLVELFRAHNAGDKVMLKVLRGKESKELTLTVERRGPTRANPNRPYSFWYGGQRENVQDQQGPNSFEYGGLYKSLDGGESWTRVNSVNPRPMYFSQVRVDPSDDNNIYVLGIVLYRSTDGGKTFKTDDGAFHPDQHALWIDPRDGRHMLLGTDGGYYVTYDRMARWEYLNHMAIGQFYHVALDSRRPYRAYGGLQDNGSWGGPSHTLDGQGPLNEDWILVSGGDGFVCRVDTQDPDLVYYESQDGHIGRRNLRTGEIAGIRPRDPKGQPPYRFNWNTPFILSNHNSHILYCGGNYVFRSVKQGDDLQAITPMEISRTKRGTATALAESPRDPNLLYAGTDDGFLWVTRDGGAKWTNIADKVGLPGPRWVASIEPSRAVEGRAYVAFDGHRSDDDAPYVYVTEDYGQTWKSLRGNLPMGSTRVLREDIENPDVLYVGTEFGVWVSIDRGGAWTKLNNNLPTVAVHELAQSPATGEMVAATHGRSLWVLDTTPLRQMKMDTLKAEVTLYRPATAMRWRREPRRGTPYGAGNHRFVGDNPPPGAQLYYSLTKKADKVQLKIVDYAGQTVRELPVKKEQMVVGLHRLTWDLVRGPGPNRRRAPNPAAPGMYRMILTVDGKEHTQGLRVEQDPLLKTPSIIADENEDEEEREKGGGRIDD